MIMVLNDFSIFLLFWEKNKASIDFNEQLKYLLHHFNQLYYLY